MNLFTYSSGTRNSVRVTSKIRLRFLGLGIEFVVLKPGSRNFGQGVKFLIEIVQCENVRARFFMLLASQ